MSREKWSTQKSSPALPLILTSLLQQVEYESLRSSNSHSRNGRIDITFMICIETKTTINTTKSYLNTNANSLAVFLLIRGAFIFSRSHYMKTEILTLIQSTGDLSWCFICEFLIPPEFNQRYIIVTRLFINAQNFVSQAKVDRRWWKIIKEDTGEIASRANHCRKTGDMPQQADDEAQELVDDIRLVMFT